VKQFIAAIRFLTPLPVYGSWGAAEADLAGSVGFFPLVGLMIGALAAGLAWGMSIVAPPMVVAAVLVVFLLASSGALHMDGLSDSADGMLSSRPRERILEIMKDSHVGAMGVIAIICVLLVKFAALASVDPGRLWAVALVIPLAGRCSIVVQMALLQYVRPEGLGKVFCRKRPVVSACLAVVILTGACVCLFGLKGLLVAGCGLIATLLLSGYFHRKIGGCTGDTFGAGCEIVEAVAALIPAAYGMSGEVLL
jgi:adenosylcobinamide-GDP ribazoletransferase